MGEKKQMKINRNDVINGIKMLLAFFICRSQLTQYCIVLYLFYLFNYTCHPNKKQWQVITKTISMYIGELFNKIFESSTHKKCVTIEGIN